MKNTIKKVAILALVTVFASSFTNYKGEKKEVKKEQSEVTWKGYKVGGSHEGTIAIKEGYLEFDNDKLTGGKFVINMTTISSTDLEGEYKGKLDGHLKSDDFFGVANHPTASLMFKTVKNSGKNAYDVTGDLTVKGKTLPITFTVSINGNKAKASLKIDRAKYDIRYGSNSFFDDLKDKAIYDEFDIIANLEF